MDALQDSFGLQPARCSAAAPPTAISSRASCAWRQARMCVIAAPASSALRSPCRLARSAAASAAALQQCCVTNPCNARFAHAIAASWCALTSSAAPFVSSSCTTLLPNAAQRCSAAPRVSVMLSCCPSSTQAGSRWPSGGHEVASVPSVSPRQRSLCTRAAARWHCAAVAPLLVSAGASSQHSSASWPCSAGAAAHSDCSSRRAQPRACRPRTRPLRSRRHRQAAGTQGGSRARRRWLAHAAPARSPRAAAPVGKAPGRAVPEAVSSALAVRRVGTRLSKCGTIESRASLRVSIMAPKCGRGSTSGTARSMCSACSAH